MTNAPLPSHLQEIIDKGYHIDTPNDQEIKAGGIYHINKNEKILNEGAGNNRENRLKVVAFCFDGPFLPVRNGASYSLYNLMSTLGKSEEILPILILCYRGDSVEKYYNQSFKTIFVDPEYYYNHTLQTKSIFVDNAVSTVQFCSSEGLLNLASYVKDLGMKVVFDVQNVDYILEERLGHNQQLIDKAKQLQIKAISKSDYVLCRSDVDRELLIGLGAPPMNTAIYNGGIDLSKFVLRKEAPRTKRLVFLAHMYYEPNENAFNFIVDKVMPRLDSEYSLTIIGNTPSHIFSNYKNSKSIFFKQGIDDLSTELGKYDVALAPIFQASGTRLKVLDYLAVGLPVVATNLAVEGLARGIESVISTGNDPESIASEIELITQHPDLFVGRSLQGRRYVGDNYDWKNQLRPFLKAYGVGDKKL